LNIVTTVYMAVVAPFFSTTQDSVISTTSGCGTPSEWKFDETHHSNQTLGDRAFYVHIPASYDQNVAHPVVLSFHGFEKDDVGQEKTSGFSRSGLKINNRVLHFVALFRFLKRFLRLNAQRVLSRYILLRPGVQERMASQSPVRGRGRRTPKWAILVISESLNAEKTALSVNSTV